MTVRRVAAESRFRRSGLRREVLAGVAVAASTLTPAPDAQAGVVYSGLLNLQATTGGKGLTPIGVDLPGGAILRVRFYGVGSSLEPFGAYVDSGSGLIEFAGDTALDRLAAGSTVDAGLDYTPGPSDFFRDRISSGKAGTPVTSGDWRYGDLAFFGFKFTDTAAAMSYYGWGRFLLGSDVGSTYLVDYAYEDAGAAITAGAGLAPLPEPGTLLLSALALAALLACRRPAG